MEEAIQIGARRQPITAMTILNLHETLMRTTRSDIAGKVRDRQNWVGGSHYSPVGAEFVPPLEGEVEPLLADLAAFMNREDLPVTLQAAATHAQFETIHPFEDGNGRVGRCLIHVAYRRRGLASHHVPPMSLLMATDTKAYVRALTAYRGHGWDEWSGYFAETTKAATVAAEDFAVRLNELQDEWRKRAGRKRRIDGSEAHRPSSGPTLDGHSHRGSPREQLRGGRPRRAQPARGAGRPQASQPQTLGPCMGGAGPLQPARTLRAATRNPRELAALRTPGPENPLRSVEGCLERCVDADLL